MPVYKAHAKRQREAAEKAAADKKAKAHTGMVFASVKDACVWYLRFQPHLSNAEVAEKVRGHFPNAKTSAASVAWYAVKMRKGEI